MADLIQRLGYVLSQKASDLPNDTRRVILKEALQAQVLDFLYNHPRYQRLNFYGGTCLHIVYQLNRLSEDLDFDNFAGVDLSSLPGELENYYRNVYAYEALTIKQQQGSSGILRFTLKFPVLSALGLSLHASETLHLKIEVSHHQQVAVLQKTPVFTYGHSFVPSHFTLETMMAGKMLACLERNFQRGEQDTGIKGRDFYDLLWFMQQGVQPLAEKLAEDGGISYSIPQAVAALSEKVAAIQINDLRQDLLPLFENRGYIQSWLDSFKANFSRLASAYR